jgi:hypothetical protein
MQLPIGKRVGKSQLRGVHFAEPNPLAPPIKARRDNSQLVIPVTKQTTNNTHHCLVCLLICLYDQFVNLLGAYTFQ